MLSAMIVSPSSGGVGEASFWAHDASPIEPAKAVSTVITILRSLPQLKGVFELISFEFSCVVSLVFLFSHR